MKTKKNYAFLDRVVADNPELAEIVSEIKQDYDSGRARHAPRTHSGCRDWWDAWLYVFRRGVLSPNHHIKFDGNKITRVVWSGPDFNDKLVLPLEKITARLGPNKDLIELRLVRVGLSDDGFRRLKALFPNAMITIYSERDKDENPDISRVD